MHKTIWEKSKESLREKIGAENFDVWFDQSRPLELREDNFVLEVKNQFQKEWIEENYRSFISTSLSQVARKPIQFTVVVKPEVPAERKKTLRTVKTPGYILDSNYTFEKFKVGPSNQFAHAAALAVSENPGGNYNPLFLYGGVGVGKTHLLTAIGHRILKNFSDSRLIFIPAEHFVNEMINSIRFEKMSEFRSKYRDNCDVLLLDDIQFIASKERTQEEFFHTFNSLYSLKKQIVITCDRFPKEMEALDERLRSRFEWGLIADIQPPEIEVKIAILKEKAETNGITLPDDVALFLANTASSNIRELEGSLIRISAFASFYNSEINLDFAKKVFKNISSQSEGVPVSIESIQKAVATHFNLKISDLKSTRKLKTFTVPRQIAMYLSRKLTNASFPEIGNKFGGKDHSTVIHATKKIKKQIEDNIQLSMTIERITKDLKG
ncbi:MAG: chromosomal replication initiator protein DnaA [bacterium]|nr:chromosomal replication initiator protein DnaA [bacterium]